MRSQLFCVVLFVFTSSFALQAESSVPERVTFNRDVRPILSDNCFVCHGPDAGHREADLRLDQRVEAVAKKAIIPGQATASEMVARILSDDPEQVMPPPDSHKTLTPRQKAILQKWIEQGAEYEAHWAYQQPVKSAIPDGVHPVDYLVRERLHEVGLSPSQPADRRTLVRRLSFDLIGLPPAPAEVAAFEADVTPDAEARLIDRILANPHFGERMALGWLDVVRYADTIGYHSDVPRNVWPYRDWVIRSFNDNKPFDRFTLEQIAGDLLPDANQETRVGSAFNRLVLSTEEGGAQPKDYEQRMLTDRVRAIGTAWLGQTTGCAQCHDHKFDPITMRDFYSLGAFFADIQEPAIGRREDGMLVTTPEQDAQLAELEAKVVQARQALAAAERKPEDAPLDGLKEALALTERERTAFNDTLPKCLVSISSPQKRTVRILPRGQWMDESGEVVSAHFPTFLPSPKVEGRDLTRLDLAQWLVSKENPLTARVVMNRLWKQLFGTGLSRVLDDLGAQGEPPVNPALLDWLAVEFMDSGWDFKHMVRVIVTSETYQQVSTSTPELIVADPNNRECARQSPLRLEAELVRDNALAISGLLVRRIGGPSTKPYQPARYWENLNFPTREWQNDTGERLYRRGLYTWWQRTFLHPSLLAFDAPSREECVAERNRSNIPQQALVLLNDPTYVEAARVFAVRVLTECEGDTRTRICWAWRQALQRDPRDSELSIAAALLANRLADYQSDSAATAALLQTGAAIVPETLSASEVAAWTHVARVLLNLHETITRP